MVNKTLPCDIPRWLVITFTEHFAFQSPTLERLPETTVIEHHSLVGGTSGEHLQLPLFRGRHQRWYASFGQFDNLTPTAAASSSTPSNLAHVANHATSDMDDLLVDNLFMSLFDNFPPGVAPVHAGDDTRQHETDAAGLASTRTSLGSDERVASSDVDDIIAVTSQRDDVIADLSQQPGVDAARSRSTSDIGSDVSRSAASSDRSSTSASTASSQRTVRHYYDERFRPGGALSAVRFGRSLSAICPPSYDDIVAIPAAETPSGRERSQPQQQQQQPPLPPPPYNAMSDDPPPYSDVMNGHPVPVVVRSTPGICTPFNGRLAVRWNSNSRVERWASSVNWITTS